MQTEAVRRAAAARAVTQATSSVSAAAAFTPGPPATIRVSTGVPGGGRDCVASMMPADAVTFGACRATMRTV